jgi:hypothetical protein
MHIVDKNFVQTTQFIGSLRGVSQPFLAQASDGLLYVVKFANNPQGPNVPFNESAGSELYRACRLPVPSWKPILVTDSFLDRNPGCWTKTPEGAIRPDQGLCFGSRYLGGDSTRLFEILPGSSFSRIDDRIKFWLAWMIDICADHSDNRQAVFVEDGKGRLTTFFLDHGHLFGGPRGQDRPNFRASRYLDGRVYPDFSSSKQVLDLLKVARNLNVDGLWDQIMKLPGEWRTTSALENFARCLCTLSDAARLQHILETAIRDHRTQDRMKHLSLRHGRIAESLPVHEDRVPDDIYRDHVGIVSQKQAGLTAVGASVVRGHLSADRAYLATRQANEDLRAYFSRIDDPSLRAQHAGILTAAIKRDAPPASDNPEAGF